jgi:type III restriction enzyme
VVAKPLAKAAIEAGAIESRTTAIEFYKTPAEEGKTLLVPQLALRVQGELQLFDDPEVLDYPWALSLFDAKPTADNLAKLGTALMVSEGGVIDIDEASGKLVQDFMPNLQRDLGLAYTPEHWDNIKLAAWLCTNLPEPSLTHASKLAFVSGWLSDLLVQSGFDLARANLQKFQMRNLLEARIKDLRTIAVKQAYQESLFGDAAAERVSVSTEFVYDFRPEVYAPSRDYDGRFGQHPFREHFYSRIGDFDSKEEFECAAWLDTQAQKGRLQYWVRNLARREGASFFFQKATGRFYPDFVCKLNNDSFLIVEYKGANGWTDAQDDRDIGGLWAKLSKGTCQFVMIKEKQWSGVDCLLTAPQP